MASEYSDFDLVLEARREHAAASIRATDRQELLALGEQLFPSLDHPWRELYFQFLQDHPLEQLFTGDTGDGFSFIFSPTLRRGLWFTPEGTRGIGPIQEPGLEALENILAEKA